MKICVEKARKVNPNIHISLRVNPEVSSSPVAIYNPCGLYSRLGTTLQNFDENIIENPLAGMEFQQKIEQKVFAAGDGSQKAPAQRLTDFVDGKLSPTLPDSSYIPGLLSRRVDELLPEFITNHLREGLRIFKKKMPTYYTAEANVVAVESRTSSPVRIPRDRETYQHIEIKGLFPCAEGAGFAGGIVSAALDGQNVAKAISLKV